MRSYDDLLDDIIRMAPSWLLGILAGGVLIGLLAVIAAMMR